MNLAPILIGTHTRLDHLKKTIDALLKNDEAANSELYIALDAPRNMAEALANKNIRIYIDGITGFKVIHKIYRAENFGHFKNFQDATDYIFLTHDRIIKLEDDIVVSPFFLNFVNGALEKFKNDESTVAVCGYLWDQFNPPQCFSEVMLLPLANGWGWGTWRSKFYKINHGQDAIREFRIKPTKMLLMHLFNPSILSLLDAAYKNSIQAGDLNWQLNVIKNRYSYVFPFKSLVRNIGWDGTGQNCGQNEKYSQARLYDKKISFGTVYHYENKIINGYIFYFFGGWKEFVKILMQITIPANLYKGLVKLFIKY